MYRRILNCVFALMLFPLVHGQISEGGNPYSFTLNELKSSSSLPKIRLKQLNISQLLEEDANGSRIRERYSLYTDTIINVKEGKMNLLPQGKIWRLRISNENAKSIQLYFNKFIVPEGARLFLYDDTKSNIAGAFTKSNMQSDLTFTVADFLGNHVIVEYFEPSNAAFDGILEIGAIGQAYKNFARSESTQDFVNIDCPIGKNSQLIKHSVCKMTFRSEGSGYLCSGALINNVKQDGKPYFLTANHCINTQLEAQTLKVYFNFEEVGCGGDTIDNYTLSGSKIVSTGQPSDYTLLLLNSTPPASYQPYYAGWNMRDIADDTLTSIHHPAGMTKKISIEYDSASSNTYQIPWDDNSTSPVNSHWVVKFDVGKTSGGSSGGPIFNKKNQIIGQLHGGDDREENYGKLPYSYTHKPAAYLYIGHYLDPDSTNTMELDGYYPADNAPDAFLAADFETVCRNAPIAIADYTAFGPYKRKWSISPAQYNFANETNDSSSTAQIEFLRDTIYTVTLNASVNGSLKSSESINIKTGDIVTITISGLPDEVCDCDLESVKMRPSGAISYTWEPDEADADKISFFAINKDTYGLVKNAMFSSDSSYTIGFNLIGNHGACIDTSHFALNILKPVNDNIENAKLLQYGKSKYFTNVCASEEEGEPVPPNTSCTAQDAWCTCMVDETEIDDILDNSVWFKFIAGSTGLVSISSMGMDNQIALYDAASAADILNGNYVILGANDDKSSTDFNPLIKSVKVVPGNTYWIQADGSACGAEGDFYINLISLNPTAADNTLTETITVYPVPANDKVHLANASWKENHAYVAIYNTSGSCILQKDMTVTDNSFEIDVATWEAGVYIAKISAGDNNYIGKIVKK